MHKVTTPTVQMRNLRQFLDQPAVHFVHGRLLIKVDRKCCETTVRIITQQQSCYRLSVPVDAALVTDLSTIASICHFSALQISHLLGSCLPSCFYCSESRVSTSNVSLLLSFCPHIAHGCTLHMQSLSSCMSSTQSLSSGTQQ